jgi:hypothetical protein
MRHESRIPHLSSFIPHLRCHLFRAAHPTAYAQTGTAAQYE